MMDLGYCWRCFYYFECFVMSLVVFFQTMNCSSWTLEEVSAWLEANGFGDYKASFIGL